MPGSLARRGFHARAQLPHPDADDRRGGCGRVPRRVRRLPRADLGDNRRGDTLRLVGVRLGSIKQGNGDQYLLDQGTRRFCILSDNHCWFSGVSRRPIILIC